MLLTDKIILGTAQLGMNYGINNTTGKPSFDETTDILDFAFSQQIKQLDTADKYGDAIENIANYHKANPTKRFLINNKFSYSSIDNNVNNLHKKVSHQLSLLQIPMFHTYMFHDFKDLSNESLLEELKNLKSLELINNIGVSIYTNQEFQTAICHDMIDTIQLPYNLLDSREEKDNLLLQAKKDNKEIHVRSVFLQGLFFISPDKIDNKLRPLLPALRRLNKIAAENNVTIEELALQYVLNNKQIDGVLIGVDNLSQLKRNINLSTNLSATIFDEVKSITVNEFDLLNPVNWK